MDGRDILLWIAIMMVFLLTAALAFSAGIEAGKTRMAQVCNVMEQNAGCPFICSADGCVCAGAKTIQVIG